jgi:NAD(P)-dependent dehydrogenase (short-subunit alcohol dehydrogenase family)
MRVLLLGGSGRFGEGVARCLALSETVSEIGLAGRNEDVLRRRASEIGEKAHSVVVDIRDERRLASVAGDYDVVVNSAGPEWEVLLPGLRAAIHAGTHYCDLGADGRTAEKQLELDSLAKEQDVVAIIGVGVDPGIDNLLAMHASKKFDSIEDMTFCFQLALPDELLREAISRLGKGGGVDSSWQLVISLISGPVRIYRDGTWKSVDRFDHGVEMKSPQGVTMTAYPCANPEQITLPRYLPHVRNMTCVCGISPPEISQLAHYEAERISREGVSVKEATRSFLETIGSHHEDWLKGSAPGWDMWLTMTGLKDSRRARYTCWPVGVGYTSIPLAVAAFRILRGEVSVRGVVPPEACFEPMSFFEEVARYVSVEDRGKPFYGESTEWLG